MQMPEPKESSTRERYPGYQIRAHIPRSQIPISGLAYTRLYHQGNQVRAVRSRMIIPRCLPTYPAIYLLSWVKTKGKRHRHTHTQRERERERGGGGRETGMLLISASSILTHTHALYKSTYALRIRCQTYTNPSTLHWVFRYLSAQQRLTTNSYSRMYLRPTQPSCHHI